MMISTALYSPNSLQLCPHVGIWSHAKQKQPDSRGSPLSTHTPYTCLPNSIQATPGCKIVYICRDAKDVFVSVCCFHNRINPIPLSLEEALEMFCQGLSYRGPYWDHVLEYWNAGLDMLEKVLFLKYEEMKGDTALHVKRLAEFMGCPFTLEEESRDVAHKIVELCSFEKLSNLEANKTGKQFVLDNFSIENLSLEKAFVGDWKNHLTAEMVARLEEITEQKWKASGLSSCSSSSSA